MKKLISMGEAIIDMKGETNKAIKDSSSFAVAVGGAPLNVLASFCLLGGEGSMITKLGDDPFGDAVIDLMDKYHIDHQYVKKTDKANTALAFVSVKEDGQRDFSFYRKPSSDMLLEEEDISDKCFKDAYAFHFCSVDLVNDFLIKAHKKALDLCKKNNVVVSFDPNIRLNLWPDKEKMIEVINSFIPYADVLKLSDDEITDITGVSDIKQAVKKFNNKIVIVTLGAKGAYLFYKQKEYYMGCRKMKAVDTTGAGDSFVGACLYYLSKFDIDNLSDDDIYYILKRAVCYSAYSVLNFGAIPSYLSKEEFEEKMKQE